jgi:hypothetical protein
MRTLWKCWHRLQLRIVHACQGESFSERAGREWQVALDARSFLFEWSGQSGKTGRLLACFLQKPRTKTE